MKKYQKLSKQITVASHKKYQKTYARLSTVIIWAISRSARPLTTTTPTATLPEITNRVLGKWTREWKSKSELICIIVCECVYVLMRNTVNKYGGLNNVVFLEICENLQIFFGLYRLVC